MNISEVIAKLESLRAAHGDIEVFCMNYHQHFAATLNPIDDIFVENKLCVID